MKRLSGSCLCGAVAFTVADQFDYVGNCLCSECRKFTGSDYSSAAGIGQEHFDWVKGSESVRYYQKSEATTLAFCQTCGSSLFSIKSDTGRYNIRLGVLDDAPSQKPAFHIHVDSKAPWLALNDDLVKFPGHPDKL
ncbi:GFA family protein [Ferrimonas balearica]|uniref:GFA family protein n=1 Tax=Ferrimonas balearica TaxID=44012 RepID=UPI001C9A2A52|nr:GFA family protein [Ferrimonas balearica]MBY5991780.1 GFA family protein [Ferrimonas balearica]